MPTVNRLTASVSSSRMRGSPSGNCGLCENWNRLASHFGIEDEIMGKVESGDLTIREAFAQLRGRLACEILHEAAKPTCPSE